MQLENELLQIIATRFSKAFDRIAHAMHQLDDEQVWYRPSSTSNSIGILVQHLNGNLHQWICSAIGGEKFDRHRPLEFEETSIVPQHILLQRINILDKQIHDILLRIPPDTLLSPLRIQGFDETVISALIAAITHLELHSGQITFISKLILDKDFKTYWQPKNKEEG